jgi:hypothetical protein
MPKLRLGYQVFSRVLMNSDQKNTDLDFKGSIWGRLGFRNVSPMFLTPRLDRRGMLAAPDSALQTVG